MNRYNRELENPEMAGRPAREMDSHEDDRHDAEDHASTGGAAGAGAVTGAVIGTVGGPAGMVAGAAAGAALGAVVERVMHGAAGHEHFEGDEEHWEGDHEHTGDDDGHDHRYHYELGYSTGFKDWESSRDYYREEFERRHGTGRRWEDVEPGYRYGYEMANDPRFHQRDWFDVEDHLHAYYDTWGRVKGYAVDPADWALRRDEAYEAWSMVRAGNTRN